MDTWINGYTMPIVDTSQDLINSTGSTVDGLTTLSFMRKRSTGDSKVIDLQYPCIQWKKNNITLSDNEIFYCIHGFYFCTGYDVYER